VFEWDERKRRWTLVERGIDFLDVLPVFEAPQRVEYEDVRTDYGERRFVILWPLAGRLVHVTYTMRGTSPEDHLCAQGQQAEQQIYERNRNAQEGGSHR
jgi:uncharacterized DUF497 family protein